MDFLLFVVSFAVLYVSLILSLFCLPWVFIFFLFLPALFPVYLFFFHSLVMFVCLVC